MICMYVHTYFVRVTTIHTTLTLIKGSYVANCIAGLHIKTQVVSHEAQEEAESDIPDRLETI